MAISAEKLAAVKQYMRIDGTDDDAIIGHLYEAAVQYLKEAGIDAPSTETAQYDLAVWSLTLHYYDHRDAVGTEASMPTGLRPIINQLKLTGVIRSVTQ